MNPPLRFTEKLAFAEAAENVTEASDEAEDAEDDHQRGFCVQPGIKGIPDCTAHYDAADEDERKFHRHRVLLRKASRLLGSRRILRVRFIVGIRGHSV